MSALDEAKELTAKAKAALNEQDLENALRYLRLAQQLDDTEKIRKRIKRIEDALNEDETDSESDPEPQSQKAKEIMEKKRRKSLNTSRAIVWDTQLFSDLIFRKIRNINYTFFCKDTV